MPVASQIEESGVQTPAAQMSPEEHACPQSPQFDASVSGVTQALPHRVQPGWQETTQCEATHEVKPLVGGAHSWPHCPQLAMSVVVSEQPDLHNVPEHPQVPPEQVGNAGYCPGEVPHGAAVSAWSHVESHPPQYCGLLVRSTQVPVQSVSGGAQAETQPIAAQRPVGAAHATPQLVQDDGLKRLASQPSLGSWLQSAHAVSLEPMAHAPPLQVGTACAIAGQVAQIVEPQPYLGSLGETQLRR